MLNKKQLSKLFLTFFKIGAFTFGGGYAMIPFIQKDVVEKNNWISEEELFEMLAISESTPGPISINIATFVGYRISGFWGAFFGTLGLVLPSFLIVFGLYLILDAFQNVLIVKYAFFGIRAGVIALIINALCKMYKQVSKRNLSYFLIIMSLLLTALFKVNPIFVIILSVVISLSLSLYIERISKK
ncbi:MAG: chromate transporter [Firmicutes bacterium]|nr:chromate transporter [Bacillota bacterium]